MAEQSGRLTIIYTGGTLGMVRSPRGYVPALRLARLLAQKSPEILERYAFDVIYTASAVSFLLPELAIPVVVTGSHIPLVEPCNDARGNLLAALEIAAGGEPAEVCVCFGPRLLRGNRTTKVRATALDAFALPNCPLLGHIGTTIHFYAQPLVCRPALPRAGTATAPSPSC